MTRLRTAGSAGALVVALAVFATACGGGDRLSARGYASAASRICRQATRRVEHTGHLEQKATALAQAASELADLRPPSSLAHFDSIWVALVRQSAGELDALVASRRAGDDALADHQRTSVVILSTRAQELARARGITACPAPFALTTVEAGTVETDPVERGT